MVEDRQSWIAWQTINEMNERKSTSRTELKGGKKNISRIYSETLLKSLINLQTTKHQTMTIYEGKTWQNIEKKSKAENLQVSTKYFP